MMLAGPFAVWQSKTILARSRRSGPRDSTRSSVVLLKKRARESSDCSRTYEKGLSSAQEGGPGSLIATQAINGRTEKFIRFLGGVKAGNHPVSRRSF